MKNNKTSTRKIILDIVYNSGASHIASSFSVVEILRAVYRSVDINKIKNCCVDRDRIIVSKGHCAAALYTVLFEFGLMNKTDLETYHKDDSLLSGHTSHFVPNVEHSTGALGHVLSVAVGICIGFKAMEASVSKTYAIIGDGELQEGSNWEALMLAGHRKLDNLCVLIDNNTLSGIGKTDDYCSLHSIKEKLDSFGFKVFEVDGHDENKIYSIIQVEKNSIKPIGIICNTIKGKGVSFMENNNVWHYRPPNKEEYEKAILEL